MPLGPGVRYRVKKTSKGPVRLAFRGSRVIEAKNMKTGSIHGMLADRIKKRKKAKAPPKFH